MCSPTNFNSLKLSQAQLQVIQELGFEHLTPIQEKSIPLLLEGKDIIGQAKTGSGKTAAFSLPILEKIKLQGTKLQALILCPTRELCTQVTGDIRKLGRRHAGLQVLSVSGGQPFFPQLNALEKGVHIVVGTPGRILDHLNRRTLDLREIETVVLDEADRMLDMGFKEDMERILNATPKTRQTMFFSATFPRTIEALSRLFQHNPVRVTIDEETQAAPNIRQLVYETEYDHKSKALIWLLQQSPRESTLVFCNLKATVSGLAQELSNAGISAGCLHGDLEQIARDRVMTKFRNHSIRVLVATDVAARGLDIADLDLVCNFDIPPQPEVYVHRIGRTGRAGKKGLAIALAMPREKFKLATIEKFTGILFEHKTLASIQQLEAEAAKKSLNWEAKMKTFSIWAGRKDKMRPGDILGALTGEALGISAADVGKIEIHDHHSYVAISAHLAQAALEKLRNGRIKGRKFRIDLM